MFENPDRNTREGQYADGGNPMGGISNAQAERNHQAYEAEQAKKDRLEAKRLVSESRYADVEVFCRMKNIDIKELLQEISLGY